MNKAVTDKEVKTLVAKTASRIFTVLIMSITALAVLSFFTRVNTTIEYDTAWRGAYAAVLIILFAALAISIIGNKSKIELEGGVIKKTVTAIAGLLGFGLINAFATFSLENSHSSRATTFAQEKKYLIWLTKARK